MNLVQGRNRLIELMGQGKLAEDVLQKIVDYAIDTVKNSQKYRVVISDSNSSSFKVPSNGIRKIASEASKRKVYSKSCVNRPKMNHSGQILDITSVKDKVLSEKFSVKEHVLSYRRRASSIGH